jgi:molybdenum cofactor guanylyltransferase
VYEMLLPYCERVFISCNNVQANNIQDGYSFIKDDESFGDIGPMTALLTAFTQFPNKNILLIGCDYPFLKADEVQFFSTHCKNEPAAFYNEADDVYEPMLAWYASDCFDELKSMFDTKQISLQHFLKDNNAVKYLPFNIASIKSIDNYKDFSASLKHIEYGKH